MRPSPCQSCDGSLSGSGMLNHKGQLRRPDLPSSFPLEGSLGAGGSVEGRAPASGEPGGGGAHGGRGGGGSAPPPPSKGLLDVFQSISLRLMGQRAAPTGGG